MKRLITITILSLQIVAVAQTTWTGAIDTDWHNACNWTTNAVPTCTDNVILPSVTNKPTVSATACFLNLEVQTGANLTVLTPSFLVQGCPCVPTVNSSGAPAQPSVITGTSPVCQGQSGIAYSVTNVAGVTYTWTYSGTGLTVFSGQGTNAIVADYSAAATSGNLIVTPSNSCGNGTSRTLAITVYTSVPAAPVATAATGVQQLQFTSNWNSVANVTTYYLDVATDAGFTVFFGSYNNLSVGNVTTRTVTNLNCGTTYYYRVRAANPCGSSANSNTINLTTLPMVFGCFEMEDNPANPPESYPAYIESIVSTADGGFAFAGRSDLIGEDFAMTKINSSGIIQLNATIGDGINSNDEEAFSIVQTADGGYALGGERAGDFYLTKVDGAGAFQWGNRMDGAGIGEGTQVRQTADGGYIMIGSSGIQVIKVSSTGVFQWSKIYTITGYSSTGVDQDIIQTTDGGYALTTTVTGGGTNDICIIKLNNTGIVQWTKILGGANTDTGRSIVQASDGGLLVAGSTLSFGAGSSDVYVIKVNSTGTVLWTLAVGGAGSDAGYQIIKTIDNMYAVCGNSASIGYLIKINDSGSLVWTKGSNTPTTDVYISVAQNSSGDYVTVTNQGNAVKFDSAGTTSCCSAAVPSSTGTGGTELASPATAETSPAITVISHGFSTIYTAVSACTCQ